MSDGPRGRRPFTPSNDRFGQKGPDGNRRDEGRREGHGNDRSGGNREGHGNDRSGGNREGGFYNRGPRPGSDRRDARPANPQTVQWRTVHYQVVTMDEEEWGDALENRLNALGRDGWRLVAIDAGRQYVFTQGD